MRGYFPFVTLVFLFLSPSLLAEVLLVPDDYDTIQEAIDAAEDDDIVEVSPGTYFESIDFLGKAITVLGVDGAESTVIDADGKGAVVTFVNEEGLDSLLDGFTITGGSGGASETVPSGGGIFIELAAPTIQNCIIEGNSVISAVCIGGGIFIRDGSPDILDCIIRDNEADGLFSVGGGIGFWATTAPVEISAPRIERCFILDNVAGNNGGGVGSGLGNAPRLFRCVVAGNEAGRSGGINIGDGEVVNCTIYGNDASGDMGGVFARENVEIRNCIIWANTAPDYPNIVTDDFFDFFPPGDPASVPTVTYSDIESLPDDYVDGEGNIEDDPLLVDPENGEYALSADSPCVDAGDPNDDEDVDGTRVDMGALGLAQSRFLRGDANGDGTVFAAVDALFILRYWFTGGNTPPCLAATDVDGNGSPTSIVDPLYLLEWQFAGGDAPPAPGVDECGDETLGVECAELPECP